MSQPFFKRDLLEHFYQDGTRYIQYNSRSWFDLDLAIVLIIEYRGSPTSTVSTSTISTSTNFIAIGIKLVLVGDPLYCYVVKLVLVEIGYVVLTSTNFS